MSDDVATKEGGNDMAGAIDADAELGRKYKGKNCVDD